MNIHQDNAGGIVADQQGQETKIEMFGNMDDFESYLVERYRVNRSGKEAVRVPLGQLSPNWIIACTRESIDEPMTLDMRRTIDRIMQMGGDHATIVGLTDVSDPQVVKPTVGKAVFDNLRGDYLACVYNEETSLTLVRTDTSIGNSQIKVDGMHAIHASVSVPLLYSMAEVEAHLLANVKSPYQTPNRESYNTPPLIDLLERSVVEWYDMPQDPRYFNKKIDKVGLVTVRNEEELALDFRLLGDRARDYAWVSPELLEEIVEAGYANALLCTARVEVIKHLTQTHHSKERWAAKPFRPEVSP